MGVDLSVISVDKFLYLHFTNPHFVDSQIPQEDSPMIYPRALVPEKIASAQDGKTNIDGYGFLTHKKSQRLNLEKWG